jgi:hypothetical protein
LLPDDRLQFAPTNYLRNRIRYRRDLPKHLLAYASVETFTKIEAGGWELKRMAWVAGGIRRLGNGREVFLEYLYQPEYHEVRPEHLSALTLGFSWDLTKQHFHHGRKKEGSEREDR